MKTTDKVKCTECNWYGVISELLTADNPFLPTDTINGCPSCKEVNTMGRCCDRQGCWNTVSGGSPTKDGYEFHCLEHSPMVKKEGG